MVEESIGATLSSVNPAQRGSSPRARSAGPRVSGTRKGTPPHPARAAARTSQRPMSPGSVVNTSLMPDGPVLTPSLGPSDLRSDLVTGMRDLAYGTSPRNPPETSGVSNGGQALRGGPMIRSLAA